jgi:hypothetical protein
MKKISLIIVLLSIFCIGCEIHCPEFPANLNYFPYYEGQELKFTNLQHDIKSFTIAKKANSKANSFGGNCKCECFLYSMFNTDSNKDTVSIRSEININGRENVGSVYINCYIEDNQWKNELLSTGVKLPDKKTSYDEISKYLEDTIILENENNQIVKKIVIIKGKGLVSYTRADGEEWNLVE